MRKLQLAAAVVVVGSAVALTMALAGVEDAEAGWERAASMSQRRSYVAAAELGGHLYAAGGMVGETGRPLATFARYDPDVDRWDVLRRLPEATRAAAAAAVGGQVYVVGGTTAEGNTVATWAYDPESRSWRARAPLPAARFNHGAVDLGGKLYVLGGFADGLERREVFAYTPAADRWTLVTRLPRANHAFGVVAYEDELWVIGGRRGEEILREVWILDPATLEWREGPELPKPMELLGATVTGEDIHAVWESTYQVYDGRSGRWRDGPTPLVTRHALEAFAVDGVLYTVGGCTTALRDSPVVERLRIGAR
jgi:N-acetylneuraminic acid mutarotase